MGQNRKKTKYLIIHCPTSEGVSEVSAAERMSEASRMEQANESAVQANERMDEQVAQYVHLDSWLFWPIVLCKPPLPRFNLSSLIWSIVTIQKTMI